MCNYQTEAGLKAIGVGVCHMGFKESLDPKELEENFTLDLWVGSTGKNNRLLPWRRNKVFQVSKMKTEVSGEVSVGRDCMVMDGCVDLLIQMMEVSLEMTLLTFIQISRQP